MSKKIVVVDDSVTGRTLAVVVVASAFSLIAASSRPSCALRARDLR